MESSVDSYISSQPEMVNSTHQTQNSVDYSIEDEPERVLTKDEYWIQKYANKMDGIVRNPAHYNDIDYRIGKFFGLAAPSQFESEYEAYLNNVNNRNERLATQSARAYDKMMDDTKYQRMFKDFEKAGLNPYLLVNNGSFSATAPTSSKASYDAKNTVPLKSGNGGKTFALIILAIAKLAAALL